MLWAAQKGIHLQTRCCSVGGQAAAQFAVKQGTKAELLIRRAKCCCFFGNPGVSFFLCTWHSKDNSCKGYRTCSKGSRHYQTACITASDDPEGLPAIQNILSHITFLLLNAAPDEGQSPEESLWFPLSNFHWLEHLAATQVSLECLGSVYLDIHDDSICGGYSARWHYEKSVFLLGQITENQVCLSLIKMPGSSKDSMKMSSPSQQKH